MYVLLGSCFAQNVGQMMVSEGWDATVNPLGTLYNTESVRQTVRAALEGGHLPMFFDETMQEWRCWLANTRFRAERREDCEKMVREALDGLATALQKAEWLVITLGTNVIYSVALPDGEGRYVVSNCQRQPDRLFEEHRMDVEEVSSALEDTLRCVRTVNPGCRMVLTVSPYRYRKYGLHGNAMSKARLLLAADAVARQMEGVYYFPAYEIMVDELRDYRYYAADGLHPAQEAIDIIWNRFQQFLTGLEQR